MRSMVFLRTTIMGSFNGPTDHSSYLIASRSIYAAILSTFFPFAVGAKSVKRHRSASTPHIANASTGRSSALYASNHLHRIHGRRTLDHIHRDCCHLAWAWRPSVQMATDHALFLPADRFAGSDHYSCSPSFSGSLWSIIPSPPRSVFEAHGAAG